MRTQASARVRLEVEITLSDVWGQDCPIGQVHKQAVSGALGLIRNLSNPLHASELAKTLRIIGDPKVTQVLVSRED